MCIVIGEPNNALMVATTRIWIICRQLYSYREPARTIMLSLMVVLLWLLMMKQHAYTVPTLQVGTSTAYPNPNVILHNTVFMATVAGYLKRWKLAALGTTGWFWLDWVIMMMLLRFIGLFTFSPLWYAAPFVVTWQHFMWLGRTLNKSSNI